MIGRVIGPYEVTASIGRGGMGEVFKARDTKLGRDVALKVLPTELARDAERLARFQREARVLASLQHQNIAAIYGLEETDGQPVLAMELAGGEDLSTRLLGGSLPANEIDKITRQLARGLEYAHEQGIVHRDLKPANVKVSGEGTVKILDFGLARAFTAEGVAEGDAESHSYQPTLTQALTGSGTVLGTAAYMSPEQARGYEVDRRSDIWAFGVILYEMMTGERLFEGETATDTLAAVLHKEPDWERVEKDHSALLVQICKRCLEKDQRQRLRDIGEARVALEGSSSSIVGLSTAAAEAALPAPKPAAARLPWAVAAVLLVACAGALFAGLTGRIGPAPEPRPLVQSSVAVPEGMSVYLAPISPGPVQVSPDGRHLCYAATDSTGIPRILVRNLADGWTRVLNGTEGAIYPFWSYDSREIGFGGSEGQIMRVPINGGPAVRVAPAVNFKGGSWNQFDEVVFAESHATSIKMVSASGGNPVDVTRLDLDENVRSHRLPHWLPDGRHFIYIAVSQSDDNPDLDSTIWAVEAATGQKTELLKVQSSAQFAAGHLLYPHDSLLMARPFDTAALAFTGPASPVLDNVMVIRAAHVSVFSVSRAGVLAYVRSDAGQGKTTIIRYSSEGEEIGPLGLPGLTLGMNFSPDGKALALAMADTRSGTLDLWQLEIERGLQTRLTFETESEWSAVYAPDGTWLAVLNDKRGHGGIYKASSQGGAGLEPLVVDDNDNYPTSFTPDGRELHYTISDSNAVMRLGVLDLETGQTRRMHPDAVYSERFAQVSPDGRWLAYSSQETGSSEIFIDGLGPAKGRWRVSADGGIQPRWAPGSDIIYFLNDAQALIAVPVSREGDVLIFGEARRILSGLEPSFLPSYAVDPISGEIVVQRALVTGATESLALVTGWARLLERNRDD
ncbi:MAG: protein kinase [Candidatus Krumholzibacteriota bacterium]